MSDGSHSHDVKIQIIRYECSRCCYSHREAFEPGAARRFPRCSFCGAFYKVIGEGPIWLNRAAAQLAAATTATATAIPIALPGRPSEIVTGKALAARLGVSDRTVRRWAAAGMPSAKRAGGARRYAPEACLKWLAGQGD